MDEKKDMGARLWKWRRKRNDWLLPVLLLLGLAIYLYWQRLPLPDDEELMGHFYAYRADIEELVRRYRAFDPGPGQSHHLWEKQGNTQELMQRAGVDRISATTLGLWFPEPYSPEHEKTVQALRGEQSLRLHHKLGVLRISPADPSYRRPSLRHWGVVWKDLYFFPEVPRVESGELVGPALRGEPQFRIRVVDTLNRRPRNWGAFECVLRPIEPQWSLRLCRGR